MKKIPMVDLGQEVAALHDLGLNALAAGGMNIHPDGHYYRASSAGMCARKAMFAYLQCKQIPRDPSSRRTLFHGTEIHKWADQAVDMALWRLGGSVIRMVPYRLSTFSSFFPDQCVLGAPTVNGTLDHLYLVQTDEGMKLVIVDHKSANEYAFKKYKKEGAAKHHRAQVGTYYNAIMPLARALGLSGTDIKIYMAYISKKDFEVHVTPVDELCRTAAESYWCDVAAAHKKIFNEHGALVLGAELPAAAPFEKWECNYCDYCESFESCASIITVKDLETTGLVSRDFIVENEEDL